jgi:hypothetical protein
VKSVYEKYMPEDDEDVTIISGETRTCQIEEESLNLTKHLFRRFLDWQEQPPLKFGHRAIPLIASSVLIVDFNRLSTNPIDGFPNLFFAMSGRDDIAVVSGLVKVDPKLWTLDYLCTNFRGSLSQLQEIYHQRRIHRNGNDGMTFDKYKVLGQ